MVQTVAFLTVRVGFVVEKSGQGAAVGFPVATVSDEVLGLLFGGGLVGQREVVGAADQLVFRGAIPLFFVGLAYVAGPFGGL